MVCLEAGGGIAEIPPPAATPHIAQAASCPSSSMKVEGRNSTSSRPASGRVAVPDGSLFGTRLSAGTAGLSSSRRIFPSLYFHKNVDFSPPLLIGSTRKVRFSESVRTIPSKSRGRRTRTNLPPVRSASLSISSYGKARNKIDPLPLPLQTTRFSACSQALRFSVLL